MLASAAALNPISAQKPAALANASMAVRSHLHHDMGCAGAGSCLVTASFIAVFIALIHCACADFTKANVTRGHPHCCDGAHN